jgi:hypothetical protein
MCAFGNLRVSTKVWFVFFEKSLIIDEGWILWGTDLYNHRVNLIHFDIQWILASINSCVLILFYRFFCSCLLDSFGYECLFKWLSKF